MGSDDRLAAGIKTKLAPTVQEAHPSYMENLPLNQEQMSLEAFMERNPRTKVRVKNAVKAKIAGNGPRVRETNRSLARGYKKTTIKVAGELVDYLEPK